MTVRYLLLCINCEILAIELEGFDSVCVFQCTAKVSLGVVISCTLTFLSSTYQYNRNQLMYVEEACDLVILLLLTSPCAEVQTFSPCTLAQR